MNAIPDTATQWPAIRTVGVDGMLVSFGDALAEPTNRAALAFRAAFDRQAPGGVEETSTTLASTYIRFDPLHLSHGDLSKSLETLLKTRDWYDAPLPEGRKLWRIPTVFGGTHGPQLAEAAAAAGVSEAGALASLSSSQTRVQAIGFAAGQPYLGALPPEWDIPRQQGLTPKVPEGALVVAIRQFVLFSVSAPTGWRHVGQTAFRCFRPETDTPFALRPGDEAVFAAVSAEEFENMRADPDGGATSEVLR